MEIPMTIRYKLLYAAMLLGTSTLPAAAEMDVDVIFNAAPPPARYETVPTMGYGYVWAPGYWGIENGRHVWVRGHQQQARQGYNWEPERWEQKGKKWELKHGYWHMDPNYSERSYGYSNTSNYASYNSSYNGSHNGSYKGSFKGRGNDDYDHRPNRDKR